MVKLTKRQLDEQREIIFKFIKGGSNAADSSLVDKNANVTLRNVANTTTEIYKPYGIQFNRSVITYLLEDTFSKEIADKYIEQLTNHEIYCHDESHPFLPYCVAIDSTPFLMGGLKTIGGETTAPKHLNSYCGNYVNLIYAIASQFAGAVADVSMLRDFHYFAKKDYGENYLETDKKLIDQFLSQIIYTLNQPAGTRGFQSVFYNTSVFDEYYFKGLYETAVFPDGSSVMDEWEGINKLQKYVLKWFNKERESSLLTFPVITAALKLNEDSTIASDDWRNVVAEEFSEGNSFFIYMDKNVTSLSSCCRLRNDISEQLNNAFSYSLGAGGVATGSKNVLTLNVNNFVQRAGDLEEQLDLMYKYQIAFERWFRILQEEGELPVYDAGYISLDKQYLTIGINGVVEAAEYLGMKANYNKEYLGWVQDLLHTIKKKNKEASKYYSDMLGCKVMFNTEFVPAENLGDKFYNWDKKAGYKVPENRNLYNSYFYPVEDTQISAIDKFKLHGKETIQYLDGGSALHLNLDEHLTKEGWIKLLNLAAKYGANYWTYNVKSTICNVCGFINKKDVNHCVKCGSTDIDKATRVIGYLRKISNFSKPRRIEAAKRHYHRGMIHK